MTVIANGDGTETVIHRHNDGLGTITFETRQDPTDILKHAQALHKEGHHGSSEMRHAASFPRVLIDQYCANKGITFREWMQDKKHVRFMLNDPDLKHFRIWAGKA